MRGSFSLHQHRKLRLPSCSRLRCSQQVRVYGRRVAQPYTLTCCSGVRGDAGAEQSGSMML